MCQQKTKNKKNCDGSVMWRGGEGERERGGGEEGSGREEGREEGRGGGRGRRGERGDTLQCEKYTL